MKIPLQTGMHHISTHVMHITFGLWQCTTIWSTKEIHRQIPNNTKHDMCAKLALQWSKYSSTTEALLDLHWLPIE